MTTALLDRLTHHCHIIETGSGGEADFTGASDVDGPAMVAEWKAAQTVAKKVLGLPQRHKLSRYVVDIYVDVAEVDASA